MKAQGLAPRPNVALPFKLIALPHVPGLPGGYVLCAAGDNILYIGRALNLRRRLQEHLRRRSAQEHPEMGYALTFNYLCLAAQSIARLERGWMNGALLADGALPAWNTLYAPR